MAGLHSFLLTTKYLLAPCQLISKDASLPLLLQSLGLSTIPTATPGWTALFCTTLGIKHVVESVCPWIYGGELFPVGFHRLPPLPRTLFAHHAPFLKGRPQSSTYNACCCILTHAAVYFFESLTQKVRSWKHGNMETWSMHFNIVCGFFHVSQSCV